MHVKKKINYLHMCIFNGSCPNTTPRVTVHLGVTCQFCILRLIEDTLIIISDDECVGMSTFLLNTTLQSSPYGYMPTAPVSSFTPYAMTALHSFGWRSSGMPNYYPLPVCIQAMWPMFLPYQLEVQVLEAILLALQFIK